MNSNKVDLFKRIELESIGDTNFYAYIIPEETHSEKVFKVWIFRENYGIAMQSIGEPEKLCIYMTISGIKELDSIGCFDAIKEELLNMK